MTKTTVTFRTEDQRVKTLDALAKSQERDRSYLINKALDNYLDVQAWQIQHIKKGLAELDRGQTLTHEEVLAQVSKMTGRCE